jgi:hypothetical protein
MMRIEGVLAACPAVPASARILGSTTSRVFTGGTKESTGSLRALLATEDIGMLSDIIEIYGLPI